MRVLTCAAYGSIEKLALAEVAVGGGPKAGLPSTWTPLQSFLSSIRFCPIKTDTRLHQAAAAGEPPKLDVYHDMR